jgi:hypothetical protein
VLKCEISHTFGGQAALNDNGIRLPSHGSKSSVEVHFRSVYHNRLNLDTYNTASKLHLLANPTEPKGAAPVS